LEDDVARVKFETVPSALEAACREAIEECPADAISVEA
jgi:ferredoxin